MDAIAAEILETLSEYRTPRRWLSGDPGGRQRDQECWVSDLNRLGVPVVALTDWYDTGYGVSGRAAWKLTHPTLRKSHPRPLAR